MLLLSDLERNVMNLQTDPRCSLHLFSTPATIVGFRRPALYDVMTKPRTTLLGRLEPVGDDPAAQQAYLRKHPESAAWINFQDFTLYRFEVEDVYVVGVILILSARFVVKGEADEREEDENID